MMKILKIHYNTFHDGKKDHSNVKAVNPNLTKKMLCRPSGTGGTTGTSPSSF